jgi:hypothetical protein
MNSSGAIEKFDGKRDSISKSLEEIIKFGKNH